VTKNLLEPISRGLCPDCGLAIEFPWKFTALQGEGLNLGLHARCGFCLSEFVVTTKLVVRGAERVKREAA